LKRRTVFVNDATAGAGRHPAGAEFQRRIEAAANAALDTGFKTGRELAYAELSVTLATVDAMRALNREYHGVDAPTDVLAFPLDPTSHEPAPANLDARSLLGDVYVCPDVAAESASSLGIDVAEEVLRLVVHGVLHLLGHEHPDTDARYESKMYQLQERLLPGHGRAAE